MGSTARLATALLIVAAGAAACGEGNSVEPPNIVLIIGDDVGWLDFGFMGAAEAHTPNLDRLAAEGFVFTHAMSSASTCKPALRTLLTGVDPREVRRRLQSAAAQRRGIPVFREVLETLPERLAERGYVSFQGGKFWEGRFEMGGFTHGMTRRYGNEAVEFEGYHRHAGADALAIGRETMEPLFSFLDAARSRPFLVWYAPLLPHLPHDAPEEFSAIHAESPGPDHLRAYRATLTWFDSTVGALMAKLDELHLREDTLVVYVSDNGWDASRPEAVRGKGSIHELGFRSPLVIAQPGQIPIGRDGRLVMLADLFATLLDAAGAEPVTASGGRSLMPLLRGDGGFHRDHVIGGFGTPTLGDWFVRTPTWRYIVRGGHESLYRIEDDPYEERDVAAEMPDVVARLRGELEEYLR